MKRFWNASLGGKLFAIVFSAALLGFVGYILIDTARIVITHERQEAVVTECRASWVYSGGSKVNKSTRSRRSSYAPVALSLTGEKATGFKKLSNKSWCQRLIGTNTKIYVNPNPKGKNSYGGFLDFWLSSFLIVVFAGAMIPSRIRNFALPCGLMFGAAALAYEFSAFGINKTTTPELLTADGKFQACIQDHMNQEGVKYPRDLRKLLCYMPTNIDLLWGMQSLENLRITNADITSVDSIARLPNLKFLNIANSPNLTDFSALEKYPKLQNLHLHSTGLASIQDIPDLPNLQTFELWSSEKVTSLNGIERFKNLSQLKIERNNIGDISAIASLDTLTVFFASYEPFTDISALRNKPLLRTARIRGAKVVDFSPLFGLPKLVHTGATGEGVSCQQMEDLRNSVDHKMTLWLPKHCK